MDNRHIKLALKTIPIKAARLRRYQEYYMGNHTPNYSSDKFRTKFGQRLKKFRDNLMKIPVQAPSDRLKILSFSSEKNEALSDDAKVIWDRSSFPRFSKHVHRAAFKFGESFVLVMPDSKGKARLFSEDARQCEVWRDPETKEIIRGAKLWRNVLDKRVYLTMYYQDRIEKYVTKSKWASSFPKSWAAFEKREVPDESHPIINETGICPLFKFEIEVSVLDDLIPQQDALNKEYCDLLIGSEANSIRQRWSTGISYPADGETGKPVVPFTEDQAWVTSEKEGAKFGNFAAVKLSEFLLTMNDIRIEIARISGVPLYYFMLDKGSFPSGEALTKAETRFTSLIENAQDDFGDTWGKTIALALLIDLNVQLTEKDTQIQTNWRVASPLSETGKLDVSMKKKAIGVPDNQLQKENNYTDKQIEDFATENERIASEKATNEQKMFDRI